MRELMPLEEVRRRLEVIHQQYGGNSAFARYLFEEVAPNAGLRNYGSIKSAQSSLQQIREGGNPSGWAHALIDQGLRRKDRLRVVTSISETEMPPENVIPESMPPQVRITVDAGRLRGFLSQFGITVEFT